MLFIGVATVTLQNTCSKMPVIHFILQKMKDVSGVIHKMLKRLRSCPVNICQ